MGSRLESIIGNALDTYSGKTSVPQHIARAVVEECAKIADGENCSEGNAIAAAIRALLTA